MSKDVSEPGTIFEYRGKLYQTIGWTNDKVVIIEPLKETDYKRCECGRSLPNQQEHHVLYSPNLQDGITKVYKAAEVGNG